MNLFFKKPDFDVEDPFTRLFRLTFHRFRISGNDFVELHTRYRRKFYPEETNDQLSTNRNNIRRPITDKPKITWSKAYSIIRGILGVKFVRVSWTWKMKDGTVVTINSDDQPDEVQSHEKSPLL